MKVKLTEQSFTLIVAEEGTKILLEKLGKQNLLQEIYDQRDSFVETDPDLDEAYKLGVVRTLQYLLKTKSIKSDE